MFAAQYLIVCTTLMLFVLLLGKLFLQVSDTGCEKAIYLRLIPSLMSCTFRVHRVDHPRIVTNSLEDQIYNLKAREEEGRRGRKRRIDKDIVYLLLALLGNSARAHLRTQVVNS